MAGRTTLEILINYRHATLLHKICTEEEIGEDWMRLNVNQNLNMMTTKLVTTDSARCRIGRNMTTNRLTLIPV